MSAFRSIKVPPNNQYGIYVVVSMDSDCGGFIVNPTAYYIAL